MKMPRNRALPLLLALLASSYTAEAQKAKKKPKPEPIAEPAPPPEPAKPAIKPLSETLTGEAAADNDAGKLLFQDRDHVGARIKFENAYNKSKDPRLLFNVAACEKNLRHYARVVKLLKQYQAEGGSLLTDEDRQRADELIKTIEPFTVSVTFNSLVEGAELSVDGEVIGTTPISNPVILDLGSRKIKATKKEFQDFYVEQAFGDTPTKTIEVKLVPIVHEGKLSVTAGKDDAISVDGRLLGVTKANAVLPSGGHLLKVEHEGYVSYQSEVVIQDGKDRTVQITLEKEKGKGVPTWVWITGGVVLAAGAGVGAYFLFKPETKFIDPPSGTGPFGGSSGTIYVGNSKF